MVEHLPRHFKDEGSIQATTADTLLLEPWKAQYSIKPLDFNLFQGVLAEREG